MVGVLVMTLRQHGVAAFIIVPRKTRFGGETAVEEVRGGFSGRELENMGDGGSVRGIGWLCIISALGKAGVVQWQYRSFPSFGRGFDSHRPLQFN